MKLSHFEDVPETRPVKKGFRGGDIRFKDLLVGCEGSPNNFALQWVTVENAYHAPQHRHNFEQIRIMMEGSFGFGPGLTQDAGSIGYFCESTYYTQHADQRSVTLLLQLGGPSGAGFMSRQQLRRGIDELATRGEFNNGVFTWLDEQGKKHNQDSYEAAWEQVYQRKLSYARPQFSGPILMRPERFAWVPTGQVGVVRKLLGRFNERGLEISQLKVDPGTQYLLPTQDQAWLLFCLEGQGMVQEQSFRSWTSIACERHERISIQATESSIFWLLGLPVFEDI